jgi:drug/metabolite transporter (DMT)-like permease
MNTPISSMLWVIGGSVIGSFGAVFLKLGAERLQLNLQSLATNWRLAVGIVFYLLSSVLYTIGVNHGELSVLYPLVSVGSIWTLLWSKLLLGEKLTKPKFVAVGMILAGCVLLGLGGGKQPAVSSLRQPEIHVPVAINLLSKAPVQTR